MTYPIVLEPREIIQAAFVGLMRQTENLGLGRRDAYGCKPEEGWQHHIDGALGEMAWAKYRGVYWTGAHRFRGDDVGEWQVRTTPREGNRLMLHDRDPGDKKFVLLIGLNGTYTYAGWILGREGKRKDWWEDPTGKGRDAYFVPRGEMRMDLPGEPMTGSP